MKREIDAITADIPHDDVAIQLDIASAVFARLQRGEPTVYGRTKEEMLERFSSIVAELADHVPPEVELLFHFCYGDSNHRHVVEPIDMGDMVEMANRLDDKVARSIELIHMPVPRDRSDAAYFAPLRGLSPRPETGLALGLVHYTDGSRAPGAAWTRRGSSLRATRWPRSAASAAARRRPFPGCCGSIWPQPTTPDRDDEIGVIGSRPRIEEKR